MVGGITGKGISSNILQAYQFISNNFERGDHIYLFGFSRGAYTARSLSGFIRYFGILRKQFQDELPRIYGRYQRTLRSDLREVANGYREKIDIDLQDREREVIPIHFLGVWDTVGALGVPSHFAQLLLKERIGFHDTDLAPNVDFAYHALAIHEYRESFRPTLWTGQSPGQTVEQVWFPGAHSDVGGGLEEQGLSNAALQWMARRAAATGLEMNMQVLACADLQPNLLTAVNESRRGFFKAFKEYERPIGPQYLDDYKTQSLNEFRHASVMDRLQQLPATVFGSRLRHQIEVDKRSATLPQAPPPD
jgi:uncharacterized protein (DUF2235 family)